MKMSDKKKADKDRAKEIERINKIPLSNALTKTLELLSVVTSYKQEEDDEHSKN